VRAPRRPDRALRPLTPGSGDPCRRGGDSSAGLAA
jgi:hypothetical protein